MYRKVEDRWFFGDDQHGVTEQELNAIGESIPSLPPRCVAIWQEGGKVFYSDSGKSQRMLPMAVRGPCNSMAQKAQSILSEIQARRDEALQKARDAADARGSQPDGANPSPGVDA